MNSETSGQKRKRKRDNGASLLKENRGDHLESRIARLHTLNEKYNSYLVNVDPLKVLQPEFLVREPNYRHVSVTNWKIIFENGGYGAGNKYISVCILKMAPELQQELINLLNNKRAFNLHDMPSSCPLSVRTFLRENGVYYADGLHRAFALCDKEVIKSMQLMEIPTAAFLYFRRDGAPMREHDAVFIGSTLNAQDTLHVPMSLGDRCHSANSTLFSLLKTKEKDWPSADNPGYIESLRQLHKYRNSVGVHPFKYLMQEHNINPDILEQKQRSRYNVVHRGVFRFSTTPERACLLEKATNYGSLNLWVYNSVWQARTFSEQLFYLRMLPRSFPQSSTGKKHLPNSRATSSSNTLAPLNSYNLRKVTYFLSLVWNCLMKDIFTVMQLRLERFFFHPVRCHAREDSERTTMSAKLMEMLTSHSTSNIVALSNEDLQSLSKQTAADLKTFLLPKDIHCYFKKSVQQEIDINMDDDGRNNQTESECTSEGSILEGKEVVRGTAGSLTLPHALPSRERHVDEISMGTDIMEDMLQNVCVAKAVEKNITYTSPQVTISTAARTTSTELSNYEPPSTSLSNTLPPLRQRTTPLPKTLDARAKLFFRDPTYMDALNRIYEACTAWTPLDSTRVLRPLADSEGFSITHRDGKVIAWDYPKIRDFGFHDIAREEEIPPDTEALNLSKWYTGYVNVAGYGRQQFRILDDRERPFTSLNPDFSLKPCLNSQSSEYFIPELPLLATALDELNQLTVYSPELQRILRVLGFRPPHRVFFLKWTIDDYISVRRALFHGIVSGNPRKFNSLRIIYEREESRISHPTLQLVQEVMSNYFESSRLQLDTAGFVVFSQLLTPFRFTTEHGWSTRKDLEGLWDIGAQLETFMNYWEQTTPALKDIYARQCTPEQLAIWGSIWDGKDKYGIDITSRLQTTTFGITTHLESEPGRSQKVPLLRTRCKLEVYIMQLVACLKLSFPSWNYTCSTTFARHKHFSEHALFAPDTGGTVIENISEHVEPQIGHLDHIIDENEPRCKQSRAIKYPPYFAMISGPRGHPLWLMEGSHRLTPMTQDQMKRYGRKINMDLFRVLPWSVIIVRGDVYHAGARGIDTAGKLCPRYHMYVVRKGIALGDSVNHFIGQWVRKNPDDSIDHLGRIRYK